MIEKDGLYLVTFDDLTEPERREAVAFADFLIRELFLKDHDDPKEQAHRNMARSAFVQAPLGLTAAFCTAFASGKATQFLQRQPPGPEVFTQDQDRN